MKKWNIIMVIILTIILVAGMPQTVKAGDDLTVLKWVVNAELQTNGDLQISEDITYQFNAKFNGVFREIMLDQTSGIKDIQVQELLGAVVQEYNQVSDAQKGDYGVFTARDELDKATIQIYSPSKDQEKTFRLRYTVKNVAVKYNDVAEVYYSFLGEENETPIESFTAYLTLPQVVDEDQVKVFAHGPLNGKIHRQNETTYSFFVKDVPSDTFIEARVLFPRELIPFSANVQYIDNYDNLIAQETAYQAEIIEEQARKAAAQKMLNQITRLGFILGLALLIVCLMLLRRERNIYRDEIFTAFPEELTPALASYMTGILTANYTPAVFATILDLSRKGYVEITGNTDRADKGESQEFELNLQKASDSDLAPHEKYFIHWLFEEMGQGNRVTLEDIQQFSKHHSSKFFSYLTEWRNTVKQDAVQYGYYDKTKAPYGIVCLVISLALFVASILGLIFGALWGIASLTIALVLFVYSIIIFTRLSDSGLQIYQQLKELKKGMKQYTQGISEEDFIDRAQDRTLLYALSLGLELKPSRKGTGLLEAGESYYSHSWIIWYLLFINQDNHTLHQSFNQSFGSTGEGSSSSGSSFTSGGGGGAGGGGTGGF